MTTKELSANELADKLLNNVEAEYFGGGCDIGADITDESWKIIQDAAIMLRTIPALEAEKVDLIMQIDIQKVVSRDLHLNVLNEIIKNQDSEIEALKAELKKHKPEQAVGYTLKDGSTLWI